MITLKEEAATTTSKTRGKVSRKESAVIKDQDKKGRESQRSKKRGLVNVSSLPEIEPTPEDLHQKALELMRNQR